MPSVSKKQHNFMAAIANNPSFAKKAGVPQSVGQDFTAADRGRKFTPRGNAKINNPDTKHGAMDMPNANLKKFSGMKHGGKVKRYNGDEGSDVDYDKDTRASSQKVYSSRGQGEDGELLDYQRRPQADVEESSSMGGRGSSSAKTKSTPSFTPTVNNEPVKPVDDRNELRARPKEDNTSAVTGLNKKSSTRAGRELSDEDRERITRNVGIMGATGAAALIAPAAAPFVRAGLGRLMAKEAVKSVPLTTAEVRAMRGAQEVKEAANKIKAAKRAKEAKEAAKNKEFDDYVRGKPGSAGDRDMGYKRGGKITKTFKKGGNVMESKAMVKKEVNFFKKKGAPASMIKHEKAEMKGMQKGGMTRSSKDVAKDQQSMSNMATYARGGGIESRGKTKGAMVKMATGGVVKFARGGGIESRGKTRGTMC